MFFLFFLAFTVFAADPAVCSWCKTLFSQIQQLQGGKGKAAVEAYIEELCSIATDEAAQVCADWTAYGMDKIVSAIINGETSDDVCAACGSC